MWGFLLFSAILTSTSSFSRVASYLYCPSIRPLHFIPELFSDLSTLSCSRLFYSMVPSCSVSETSFLSERLVPEIKSASRIRSRNCQPLLASNIKADFYEESYLHDLSSSQREIVTADLANIRVHAGPGSGKTRVLVSRVAHLIKKEEVLPSSILAVTFTKKASKEMKGRLTHLLLDTNDVYDFSSDSESVNNPDEGVKKQTKIGLQNAMVTCTTLHSFCCQIVRKYSPMKDFTLYDTADCLKIVKQLLKEAEKGHDPDKIDCSPHDVYPCLSMIKRQMLKRISYKFDDEIYEVANNMLHDYNLALRRNNAYDFDDLILETLNILLRNGEAARAIRSRYKHIFCDEWQDVDKSQYCLLLMLLDSSARKLHFGEDIDNYMNVYKIRDANSISPAWRPDDTIIEGGKEGVGEGDSCRTFFVVGDSKQTIFSWRGADNRNMNYFAEDIPKCLSFELYQNYRSHKDIIRVSQSLFARKTIPIIALNDASSITLENKPSPSGHFLDRGSGIRLHTTAEEKEIKDEIIDSKNIVSPAEKSDNNGEPVITVMSTGTEAEQAEYVSRMISYYINTGEFEPNKIAIMYRYHKMCESIEVALISRKIKYRIYRNTGFIDAKEVKDALAYLRILTNPFDAEAMKRAINYPPRGIGEATQEAFFKIHDTFGDTSSDFAWTASALDLLFLVGSVAERKAATSEPKISRLRLTIEDKPEAGEYDLKESDSDSSSLRLLEDEEWESAQKNGQTKKAKEILSSLSTRQLKTLSGASNTVLKMKETLAHWEGELGELINKVLQESGIPEYIASLPNITDEEKELRLGRLGQLIAMGNLFDQADFDEEEESEDQSALEKLKRFLDDFLLAASEDNEDQSVNGEKQAVNLMSIHASKGLEFDCVFIINVEEDSLPMAYYSTRNSMTDSKNSSISFNDYSRLAEEKRLFYVDDIRLRAYEPTKPAKAQHPPSKRKPRKKKPTNG